MDSESRELAATDAAYTDEVLCAGWNPIAHAVIESRSCAETKSESTGDIESLLARLYLFQRP